MDVHEQHQSLHRDHIDPLTVEPGHLQNFEVSETQNYKRQQEGEGVEKHGEDDKLGPAARPGAGQGAGRVKPVVAHPGEAGGHRGEGHGVRPRVAEHERRVLVAHLGVIPQGEHDRDPPVDAQGGHAQHGVGGQEGLQEAHELAEAVSGRLRLPDESRQSERHVGHCQQQVAEGEVEVEQTRDLLADLRVVREADQHQDVGQQRHDDDHNYQQGKNHLRSVHSVPHCSPLCVRISRLVSFQQNCKVITRVRGCPGSLSPPPTVEMPLSFSSPLHSL